MKKSSILIILIAMLFMWSCGNSDSSKDNATAKSEKSENQHGKITGEMIVGEWECVDITNGVTHMESIAKMQPHLVFTPEGEILTKTTLSDGTEIKQKAADYKIEDGILSSLAFETNPYFEDGRLVVDKPSEDSKMIYEKK